MPCDQLVNNSESNGSMMKCLKPHGQQKQLLSNRQHSIYERNNLGDKSNAEGFIKQVRYIVYQCDDVRNKTNDCGYERKEVMTATAFTAQFFSQSFASKSRM